MSVFSQLRLSRKAAKEHKQKEAEKGKGKEKEIVVPYRHVPTHAAVDALSGAPSTWKAEDRPKIRNHHQRRSQMTMSRTASTLSTTSYMTASNGQSSSSMPPLPRNSSYSSYNPTWFDRTGDISMLTDPPAKRYKPTRGHSYHDSGIGPSPLSTNTNSEAVSPVVSSGTSTTSSSSDPLEINAKPYNLPKNSSASISSRRNSYRPSPGYSQGHVFPEQNVFDRLHKSTTRKLGEAPVLASPPAVQIPRPNTQVMPPPVKKSRWSMMSSKRASAVV